eukprot:4071784-Pyramimonas_sp.AAC.1
MYLGVLLGPDVTMQMQRDAARMKLKLRARLPGSGSAPLGINGVLYRSRAIPVLSYLAQFYPLPPGMAAFELSVLAQTFRAPMGTQPASGWAQLAAWEPHNPSPATLVRCCSCSSCLHHVRRVLSHTFYYFTYHTIMEL